MCILGRGGREGGGRGGKVYVGSREGGRVGEMCIPGRGGRESREEVRCTGSEGGRKYC